jgi:hypothetical protein
MYTSFEAEKNRKAFTYTAIIVGALLLLAILITWPIIKPPVPLVEDLIEINLGNNAEGYGEVQPLIKGEMAPSQEPAVQQQKASAAQEPPAKDIQPDDNADEDAAPVTKPNKVIPKATAIAKEPVTKPVKTTTPAPVVMPVPKPQKPKATYNGSGNGKGNGATEDNGYTYQGNKPGGKGDAGDPSGKPDSYGNNSGGRTGGSGLRVSKGDRTIVNNYIFMGDLQKATINAIIKVSPEGSGVFVGFDKGSTSSDSRYSSAIRNYLPNIKFNKSDHESVVTVPFNFKVQ